jgi:hypothetical protein
MKFVLLFLACIPCIPVPGAAASQAGERKPNIVFLLTDDQSTYSMGCYGNGEVKTPHLDALAREGVVFDCHYVSTAICMASRANIMTGKFEFRHGCNFEHGALHSSHWASSYPILLKEEGYLTAMAGKIGFEVTTRPGKKGVLPAGDFDKWGAGPGQTNYRTARNKSMVAYAEKYPHSSRAYGAFGTDFIAEAAKEEKPFCPLSASRLLISLLPPIHWMTRSTRAGPLPGPRTLDGSMACILPGRVGRDGNSRGFMDGIMRTSMTR